MWNGETNAERMYRRSRTQPWLRLYNTKRWKDLRIATFIRDAFTCRCGCGRMEANTSLLVCDHIEPHRGDEQKFWDAANLQTLLKSCHSSKKQREEQASLRTRGVWY